MDANEIIGRRFSRPVIAEIFPRSPSPSASAARTGSHRPSQSYYEAHYAIKIRKLKGGSGVLASFDDLGSYGLLLGLQDTLSLEVFYDSVLGKLREYDEQNSSDLVNSLACFLEANGHWGDAAEKLYVHRHTLRYRMKRVEEITGRDLNQSQDRMEFWLALKAKELIDQSKKGKPASA
jgi:purine catabolism regulator